MNRSRTGSKQKRSKYSVRLVVAAKLIATYGNLPGHSREIFEGILALHVYGEDGMHPYHPFPDDSGDSVEQCSPYGHSRLYECWFNWAQEIKGSSLDYFERREAVTLMTILGRRRVDVTGDLHVLTGLF